MPTWGTNNFAGGMNDFLHPALLEANTASLLVNACVDDGKIMPIHVPELYDSGKEHTPDDLGDYRYGGRSPVKWYDIPYWSYDKGNAADGAMPSFGTADKTWGGPGKPWNKEYGNALGVPYVVYDKADEEGRVVPSFTVSDAVSNKDEATGGKPYSELTAGRRRYCITFVNWHGWEGAPGSLTSYEHIVDITVPDTSGGGGDAASPEKRFAVTISLPQGVGDVPVPDNVCYAKVYRTIDNGNDFYLAGYLYKWRNGEEPKPELPSGVVDNNWTFTDTLPDSILTMKSPLLEEDMYNYPPKEGGRFLCESGGVFFLAYGSSLRFSRQDNPHAWNPLNQISFEDTIKGIVPDFSGGVIVLSANNAWRVVGAESRETIQRAVIPGNQGCYAAESISSINNAPVWLSNDGICTWDGQKVEVVTFRRLKIDMRGRNVLAAATHDSKYYLLLTDGFVVFDQRSGGIFYKIMTPAEYIWTGDDDDRLYLYRKGCVSYFSGRGSLLDWTYRSPLIGDTELMQRIYSEIIIATSESCSVSVEIDGQERVSLRIPAGKGRFKLPRKCAGRTLQFEVRGHGVLSELGVAFS